MNNHIKHYILLFTVIFAISTLTAQASSNTSEFNADLKTEYQKKISYKKEVYDRTLRFVNDNLESPGLATLYFNLAEMSTEINVSDPQITTTFYQKVLQVDENFLYSDAVLYNIGYYGFKTEIDIRNQKRQDNIELVMNWPDSLRLTDEKLEYIIGSYLKLIETFPESNYYTEAYYRLGIAYFELALDARTPQEYFQKSVEYFDKVALRQNDKLQNYGLFQRAWTYFTMGNFTEAIIDFTQILKIIKMDSLQIEKTFFKADAIENIAFSLIEYDGTDFIQYSQAAKKAIAIFHTFVSEEYGKEILLKSINLKHRYNAPMQAADLYNAYITLYPASLESPSLVDSIVTIYKNNPDRTRKGVAAEELIINQYKRLTTQFRADSLWYQSNQDNDISEQINIIKNAYEFLEPKYYNIFVNTKNENNYFQYKELVINYCKFKEFDSTEESYRINKSVVDFSQELAEESSDPSLYFETIDNINNFLFENEDSENIYSYQETKFYNHERIFAILDSTVQQNAYIDTTRGINLDRDGLDSLYIAATDEYKDFLMNYNDNRKQVEKELVRIIFQRAELYYNRGEFDKAFADYEIVLQYQSENDLKKVTYSRLAEISQNKNNYNDAEKFYREAAKYATADEKEDFNNNILATMQAKAVTFADSADYITSAQEFIRISEELKGSDPDKSIGFIVKAIESYQKAEEHQTAVDLYLEIASKKDSKNDILAAYISAWTITDSLNDWSQSEKLRKQFINKYKESNEAYKLRIQIIGFYEGEQFNDKEKAAQMYLQLHDETDNMDIGEDSQASIFLNAYRIYVELENENKIVELSLLFDKLYPDHPKSNDFLVNVAKIYNDRGEEKKFEELAAYLYKKDPNIDLLVKVAAEKLKKVKAEVDTFFVAEQYELMYDKIREFEEMDKHYQAEGLDLPTDAIYDNFAYYNNYATFNDKFHAGVDAVKSGFLAETPDDLIRVNELTEWKKHLVEGKRRIPKLMEMADVEKEKVFTLIKEGNEYNLKTEDRTEALYVAAQTYDYGADVVITQIQKYLDVSNQLNNDQMNANPVQQEQYKNTIMTSGNQIRLSFLKKAVQLYKTILTTFSSGKDYSDEWVENAYDRLVDLGIEKPKIHEYYYTNYGWKNNRSPIGDLASTQYNYGIWKNVEIVSEQVVLDSAYIIAITDTFDTYLKKDIETEITPELISISYAYDKPLEIYINNELLEKEPEMNKELIQIGDELLPHYFVSTSMGLKGQKNSIIFKIPADTNNDKTPLFVAQLSLQFDKENIEFHRTTEMYTLVSDFSWYAKKDGVEVKQTARQDSINNSEVTSDSSAAAMMDEGWLLTKESNFKFFKSQMYSMENSEAIGIWYPVIDSNNVETVLFRKELEISGEVSEAILKCIGQNLITIWINGELIVEDRGIVVDELLKKIQPFESAVEQLLPGINTIEIEVKGGKEYKGLIFEMNYRAKKKLTE
ncbi:MAG: hypothetical protein P9L97_05510 [Candidatus Tenebribacter davisii]|nr:hypothetical protein [Candidatus Tenebribacter davisii]